MLRGSLSYARVAAFEVSTAPEAYVYCSYQRPHAPTPLSFVLFYLHENHHRNLMKIKQHMRTPDVRLFHERLRVRRAAGADACEEARARGLIEEPPALRRRVRFAVGVGAAARRVPSLRQERVSCLGRAPQCVSTNQHPPRQWQLPTDRLSNLMYSTTCGKMPAFAVSRLSCFCLRGRMVNSKWRPCKATHSSALAPPLPVREQ